MPAEIRFPEVPLERVLKENPRNGYSPKEAPAWTGLSALGLGCLTPKGFEPRQLKNIPDSAVARRFLLEDGDLLMSRANTRALVGLAGIFSGVQQPCIYPDLMMRLRADPTLCLPEYLSLVLLSDNMRRTIQGLARGTSESMVKISGQAVKSLRIPLPSIAEQRKIVEVHAAFDRRISALEGVVRKFDKIQNAVASDFLAEQGESSWRELTLGRSGQWLSGGTPSTSNDAYWGGDIPWISATSLKSFHVARSDRQLTLLGVESGSRIVPPGATLFVNRGMSLKSEFRIGVARNHVAFGQDCKAIIPISDIDPYFLGYAVRVQSSRILGMVEETSHGAGRLDTRRVQEIRIKIPPLSVQRKLVATQNSFERQVDSHKKRIAKLRLLQQGVVDDLLSGRVAAGE